jgi:hypothetical protein
MSRIDKMDVYFVSCNIKEEKEALKIIQPPRLLLSYYYFKKKSLNDFIEEIGYKPIIMLDSGAYSSFTKGKNISPIDYMNYINENKEALENGFYISLDVIGEPEISLKYYEIMKLKGFNPLPVFHFGDDETYLKLFVKEGNDYIALGNTVPIKNKKIVAEWVQGLIEKYPNVKFHLLGSTSKKITQNTDIHSCDSSTWIMMAINGFPKEITGKSSLAKIERAKWHLQKIMEENK